MTKLLTGALAALFLCLGSGLAAANGICMSYDMVTEKLRDESGEAIIGRGVMPGGRAVVEMWGDAGDGSWTVLQLQPNGMACLAFFGDGFHVPDTPPPGEGT